MQKEILFRAKRKDNNEWIEGSLLILESGYYIVPIETYYNEIDIIKDNIVNAIWEEQDFFEVIPETVSQYTNKTINNEKIFTGNILKLVEKTDSEDIITYYEVYFDIEEASFFAKCQIEDLPLVGLIDIVAFDEERFKLELVGNKFDNPELLDKES